MNGVTTEILEFVNRGQIEGLRKASELDPSQGDACKIFTSHVQNVEAALRHTYQITSFIALRRESPAEAAKLWEAMVGFCASAIDALKAAKARYPNCGTSDTYDLAIDYWRESNDRLKENLEDAKWETQIPAGLFQTKN